MCLSPLTGVTHSPSKRSGRAQAARGGDTRDAHRRLEHATVATLAQLRPDRVRGPRRLCIIRGRCPVEVHCRRAGLTGCCVSKTCCYPVSDARVMGVGAGSWMFTKDLVFQSRALPHRRDVAIVQRIVAVQLVTVAVGSSVHGVPLEMEHVRPGVHADG